MKAKDTELRKVNLRIGINSSHTGMLGSPKSRTRVNIGRKTISHENEFSVTEESPGNQ